jgi:hypothetical protein
MKIVYPYLLILACLTFCPSCYPQNDSTRVNKSERKVIVHPNPFIDSAQISITGGYHLKTLKISICSRGGQAVMEFTPKRMPFTLKKGYLAPGRYYVRCIDKYGRIPSKKMTIKGETVEEIE